MEKMKCKQYTNEKTNKDNKINVFIFLCGHGDQSTNRDSPRRTPGSRRDLEENRPVLNRSSGLFS